MHILIVNNTRIPAFKYGGTERVIWWLGKELVKQGHRVTYLVADGSVCDFAEVLIYNPVISLQKQIPANVDIIHMHFPTGEEMGYPTITTLHGNVSMGVRLPMNCVFVSKNHALRHASEVYVHNGLDFEDYGEPGLENERRYYHFLANAAWRVKNLRGAIEVINKTKEKLVVLGGTRLNFKMGFRFTPYLNIKFRGLVGGEKKHDLLRHSKGLIFPVLWNEPFGLAVIESLYFGCPVFGTPYGSLPELVTEEVGFLSAYKSQLINKIKSNEFDSSTCHSYAVKNFNSKLMTERYLILYRKVINGETLNEVTPTLKENTEKFLPFYA
jgi:glycosyltransferase involved in cell wall biosynthesis